MENYQSILLIFTLSTGQNENYHHLLSFLTNLVLRTGEFGASVHSDIFLLVISESLGLYRLLFSSSFSTLASCSWHTFLIFWIYDSYSTSLGTGGLAEKTSKSDGKISYVWAMSLEWEENSSSE